MQTLSTYASPTANRYVLPRPTRVIVVVIDEDTDTQRILGTWLGSVGFTVVAAADAGAAAALLAGRRPAVIISELRGRQVNARVLLDDIRGEPALAAIPLIVHTSRVTPAEQALAGAVADLLIAKPSRLVDVLAAVRMFTSAPSIHGDDEGEAAARARLALDVDSPPMRRGDAVGDEESQPGTALQ